MRCHLRGWSLLLAAATAFCASGCTTTYVTPMAVAKPARIDTTMSQSSVASQKAFELPMDWQYGDWVMKKGARITFYDDGFGSFSGTVYSQYSSSPNELHFQSIQYGADGTTLFLFPSNDVGMAMALRGTFQEHPYQADFAYDKRHFDDIFDVKWFARLRLQDQNLGNPKDISASYAGNTRFDLHPYREAPGVSFVQD